MRVKKIKMKEIVRVTADRNVLYMKLPMRWRVAAKLHRGSYLVVKYTTGGKMTVTTWDQEVKNGKRIKAGAGK